MANWAKLNGVPKERIIVGEFGALRTPAESGVEDDGSRFRWAQVTRAAIEAHGFGWALYVNRLQFGLYKDPARLDLEPEMLSALGLKAPGH